MRDHAPFWAVVAVAIMYLAGLSCWWLFSHWDADLHAQFDKCNADPQCREGTK